MSNKWSAVVVSGFIVVACIVVWMCKTQKGVEKNQWPITVFAPEYSIGQVLRATDPVVLVNIQISDKGELTQSKLIGGDPELGRVCLQAAKKWRFSGGKPCDMRIEFVFNSPIYKPGVECGYIEFGLPNRVVVQPTWSVLINAQL